MSRRAWESRSIVSDMLRVGLADGVGSGNPTVAPRDGPLRGTGVPGQQAQRVSKRRGSSARVKLKTWDSKDSMLRPRLSASHVPRSARGDGRGAVAHPAKPFQTAMLAGAGSRSWLCHVPADL